MRNWIDLFEGSREEYTGDESLYHGTDTLSLTLIMMSNYLSPSIDHSSGGDKGVSLTNNIKTAWDFASRSCGIFDENHNHYEYDLGDSPSGGLLCFNPTKLRGSYRLVEYVDHLTFDDGDGDEDEIRVLCNRLEPLSQYIEWFTIPENAVDWFKKYFSIPAEAREYTNPKQIISVMEKLYTHPKFRRG